MWKRSMRSCASRMRPTEARLSRRELEVAGRLADVSDLVRLLLAIAAANRTQARALLDATPSLVNARLTRADECFIDRCQAQIYEGDTALHAAGFAYDHEMARELVARGADVHASNRRGAQPLHAAVIGVPGTPNWDPPRQRAVIEYLIE